MLWRLTLLASCLIAGCRAASYPCDEDCKKIVCMNGGDVRKCGCSPPCPPLQGPSASSCCPLSGRIHVPANCGTITAAVVCAQHSNNRTTIALAAGLTFREKVIVPATAGKVTIVGMGAGATIIWPEQGGPQNGTLVVNSDDFILANVIVSNDLARSDQPGKNFALNLLGDRMAVYRSAFFGKDDMLYTGHQRVYIANSVLNGSTDFLFGQGAAVFYNCTVLAEPGQFWSFVTAANGNSSEHPTAWLLDKCRLPAQPGVFNTFQ